MGFLKKIAKTLFGGGAGGRPSSMLDFYVRCNNCGQVIHGRINLSNDLSVRYEGDDQFYFCRKGLVGSGETRCFQQVIVEYTFDARRQVIDRRAEGGRFVEPSPPDEFAGEG